MKPNCYNRGPFVGPRAGWYPTGNARRLNGFMRPVYRYRWPRSTDRCAAWDGVGIGQPTQEYPTGTPYPIAHGWDCEGCRWKPEGTP